jgi:3-deoxy-D-manno-octulosonic-acid transferase
MVLIYNLALLLASPLLALYLAYRLVIKGKSREGFHQRLGWAPSLPRARNGRVWLHAVSAGEVVAAAAIARRLAEAAPEVEVVVSTTTPAGQQQARRLVPQAQAWFYFPFDFLPCAALALLRVKPTAVAAVETEIWPNWLWLARALGARAALVNGQFADKGFRGARRARPLYRWALGRLDALWMQTAQAAERALFLGAPAERVRVVGNAKFEQVVPSVKPETEAVVRDALALSDGRPLWVAGSTHPGEEEQVLEAYRAARERVPGLALLLVPRHVERSEEVLRLVLSQGWTAARRSTPPPESVDVLVLDTMGELASLYGMADVVFVGGSLVPIGGHDILQPLFAGRPTLFGPHMHNQQDLARLAVDAGAALQIASAAELAETLSRLLADASLRARLSTAGETLLRDNSGAAREYADLLAGLASGRGPREELHLARQASGSV